MTGNERIVMGAAAVLAALLLPVDAAAQRTDTLRWTGQLAGDAYVEVRNIAGDVRVEPTSGDRVEVLGIRRARHSRLEDVDMSVEEHGEGVTVCVVYAGSQSRGGRRGDRDEHRRGRGCPEHNHLNLRDNDARMEFVVRVPRGRDALLSSVSGDVEAKGLTGYVDAYTVSGDVEVTTAGAAQAGTVSGDIEVTIGVRSWEGELDFHTVSGDIEVTLPAGVDADVRAATMSGDIDSDFPLEVSGRFSRKKVQGSIGRGGPGLNLETLSGTIRLIRS